MPVAVVRQGPSGPPLNVLTPPFVPGDLEPGPRGYEIRTWWDGNELAAAWLPGGGGAVYLSDYLARDGINGNVQRALKLLLDENPDCEVVEFPQGETFEITEHDNFIGLRSNLWLKFNGCTFRIDMTDFSSGMYVFAWQSPGPYTNVRCSSGRFVSYNQPSSTFGCSALIGYEVTSYEIEDCYFECEDFETFGTKMSVGFAGGGLGNVHDCTFVRAQLALAQNQTTQAHGNLFVDCNDFGISTVGVNTASVRRISIRGNVFDGIAGSGAIFCGSDGTGPSTALDVLEDLEVCDNVIGGDWGGYWANDATGIIVDSAVTTRRIRICDNVIGRNDSNPDTTGNGIRLFQNDSETTVTDVAIDGNTIGRLGALTESVSGIFVQWNADRFSCSRNIVTDNRGIEIHAVRQAFVLDNFVDNGIVNGTTALTIRAEDRAITELFLRGNYVRPRTPGFPFGAIFYGPNNITAELDNNTFYESVAALPTAATFNFRLKGNNFNGGIDATFASFVTYFENNRGYPAGGSASRFTVGTGSPAALAFSIEADGQVIGWKARATRGAISPALNSDQSDWAPTGLGTSAVLLITPNGTRALSGIDISQFPVGFRDGVELDLFNLAGAFGDTISLFDQAGTSASTNQFLCPMQKTFVIPARGWCRIRYDLAAQKWRIASTPRAITATLSVAVPALAAGELGYVSVVCTGTQLENVPANSPITANPQADVEAAGAGNGGFINARASALNTVRFAFLGATTSHSVNFTVSWTGQA